MRNQKKNKESNQIIIKEKTQGGKDNWRHKKEPTQRQKRLKQEGRSRRKKVGVKAKVSATHSKIASPFKVSYTLVQESCPGRPSLLQTQCLIHLNPHHHMGGGNTLRAGGLA